MTERSVVRVVFNAIHVTVKRVIAAHLNLFSSLPLCQVAVKSSVTANVLTLIDVRLEMPVAIQPSHADFGCCSYRFRVFGLDLYSGTASNTVGDEAELTFTLCLCRVANDGRKVIPENYTRKPIRYSGTYVMF